MYTRKLNYLLFHLKLSCQISALDWKRVVTFCKPHWTVVEKDNVYDWAQGNKYN
jgi:hypothetical protein